jgi:hypothetical protein
MPPYEGLGGLKVWDVRFDPPEDYEALYKNAHSIELDELIAGLKDDPVLDKLGSDYDEDGVAYWEK